MSRQPDALRDVPSVNAARTARIVAFRASSPIYPLGDTPAVCDCMDADFAVGIRRVRNKHSANASPTWRRAISGEPQHYNVPWKRSAVPWVDRPDDVSRDAFILG